MNIKHTPIGDLLRIEAGQHVFLASKRGFAVRDAVLLHKPFTKVDMVDGVALHLHYQGRFNVWDKWLEVEAISKLSHGPLGERKIFNAKYDDVEIGNYSALISYAGGGSNGSWPFLRTEKGIVFFSFYTQGMGGDSNEVIIETYREMIVDNELQIDIPPTRYLDASDVSPDFLAKEYSIEDIRSVEQIVWEAPVVSAVGGSSGVISCLKYPGYERYYESYYGDMDKIPEDREFIGRSASGESLHVIRFQNEGSTEYFYPWDTEIDHFED